MSAPPAPTENTDTPPPAMFPLASRLPSGLNATEADSPPLANGEPVDRGERAARADREHRHRPIDVVCGREQAPVRAERNRGRARAGRERRAGDLGERAVRPDREHRHTADGRSVSVVCGREQAPVRAKRDRARAWTAPGSPAGNGEPGTGVSAPPAPTENTDTLPPQKFAVASSFPSGLNATEIRAAAAAARLPGRERRARDLAERAARADREHRHVIGVEVCGREQPPSRAERDRVPTARSLPVGNGEPRTCPVESTV